MGQVTDTKNHVPQSYHQQVFHVVDDGRLKRTDYVFKAIDALPASAHPMTQFVISGNLTTNSTCAKNHNITLASRGIYEDSRMRIIHRDLKTSNDQNLKSKISDFGIARLLERDQTHAETERVVETSGYMAPEYYNNGTFSIKSDVYSFGVLVLEILSGKKISNREDLRNFAWENHRAGTPLRVIDPTL